MKRNVHEIWTDNSSVAPLGNHFSSKFISTEQKRTRSDSYDSKMLKFSGSSRGKIWNSSFYPDDGDHSHDPEIRRKDYLSQSSARNYSEYCLSNDRNKSNNFAYYSCDLSASCGGVTSSYDDCFHNSRLSDEVEDHDFESSHVNKRSTNHDLKSAKALHPLRQVSPSPSSGSAATSRHSSRSAATVPSNEKVKEYFCRSVVSHDRYPPCPSTSSRSSERSRSPARAITACRPVLHEHPSSSAPMLTPPPDYYSDLPLEWWEREEDCKTAKMQHMERVDNVCRSREDLVLLTTLWRDDITMEPNMFPCKLVFPVIMCMLN